MTAGKDALAQRLVHPGGNQGQWNSVAPGWARQRGYVWSVSSAVGERLVELLAPLPGETILELAAGPGDTGFATAPRLGSAGKLISTDVSPEMVEAAKARGHELGLTNVDYRVVDAQAIDLPEASVDGVLCRWGYMLVPDPARAFAETFRVLRPGGRVSFSVWAEPEANPFGTSVGRALLSLDLIGRPDPDAPGPFRLGDAERVRQLVRNAGFAEPDIAEMPVSWRHASFDDYWNVTSDLSFLLTSALAALDPEVVAEVRARTQESLQQYTSEDGTLGVPGLTRNVLARKLG